MNTFDLGSMQDAAAADPRPKPSTPDGIPTGTSPVDQAVAGYAMAVNLVTRAAELDCDADWRRRQRIYAAEIARLQTEGGTVDPAVIDKLNTESVRATLNTRYCAELNTIAQAGYERIFELMSPGQAGANRTEILERMAATVDEINALTQRLIDQFRPGSSVYEFLSARTLDTTVPPY
ncbi:MAG: hypothetical protein JO045_30070 [Mycobacterium sp.]|nr:hypothetical protein [Mycobacterium sp.]